MILTPIEKFKRDFQNKRVLVMGLGLLGRGVQDAIFLSQIGAKVTVTDLKNETELASSLKQLKHLPIELVLGEHREKDFLNSDVILRNAAVPNDSPFLELARRHQIPIEMDEALFAKYAPVSLIGITGTRGKSTTTALIYQILKEAKYPVYLAGNIEGRATLPLLAQVAEKDLVVMELSSWQLQGFRDAQISPHISVVTTIYEDHLNRYPSMASYLQDKKAIFQFQQENDFLLLNKDFKELQEFATEAKAKVIWFSQKEFPQDWQLKLKGRHNQENVEAAVKVAELLKIEEVIIKKVVENFSTLPHRLESLGIFDGIEYINDTTSTTPVAGIKALQALAKPIILLAGGASKNIDPSFFAKEIVNQVKWVILLSGTGTAELRKLITQYGGGQKIKGEFTDFKEAVSKAKTLAQKGEIILLSPGFASFGLFVNEFDRGEKFKKIVYALNK